jgi:hypothetical protein
MFMRLATIRAGRCEWMKNDSERTGGQGVVGSNPAIPTNFERFPAPDSERIDAQSRQRRETSAPAGSNSRKCSSPPPSFKARQPLACRERDRGWESNQSIAIVLRY